MSLSPAVLDAMLAAGCTAEQIVAVVKADLEAHESQMAEKRQKDAERQRKHRERNAESRDVTVTECDSVTDPLSRPPNENNSNPPTHTPGDIPRARKGADFPMVDCTDPDTWADFLRNRKAKKLPNTASAHRKLVADLADISARTGWPPGRVFAACVAKGWGAIYDPRDKTDGKQHSQSTRPAIMDIGRSVAADLEREAAARAGY